MSAAIVHFFFTLRDQIKLYHWQTTTYSRHRATDAALEKLDGLIDSFVEVFIGKYGRPKLNARTNTISLQNLNDKGAVRFVQGCVAHIAGPLSKTLHPTRDNDLLSLRDEMVAELNQLLYLFSLH